MSNLIKFEKPNIELNENLEEGWRTVCSIIDKDFALTGFQSYSQQFKDHFRPIYEMYHMGQLTLPNIDENDPNPIHQEWRESIEKSLKQIQIKSAKILASRYFRELELFFENNVPIE